MDKDRPTSEVNVDNNSIIPPNTDGSGQSTVPQPSRQEPVLYQNGIYPEPIPHDPTSNNSRDLNGVRNKKRFRGKKTLIFSALFIMFCVLVYTEANNGFIKISQTTPEPGSTIQRTTPKESSPPTADQLLPLDNLCYSAELPEGFVRAPDEADQQKNKGVRSSAIKEDVDSCRQFLVSSNTVIDGNIETITDFSSEAYGKLEDIRSSLVDDDPTSTTDISDIKVDGSNAIRVRYRYSSELYKNLQKTRVYVWNDKGQKFDDGSSYKYLIIEALIRNADKPDIDSTAIDDFLQSLKWK
jgi:hypothetical protein